MKKCIYTSLVASIISFTSLHTFAQPEQPIPVAASADKYELELVAKGVQIPWGMVWLNKQDLLVTNRAGDLRLIRDGKLLEKAIKGVPKVHAERQGGHLMWSLILTLKTMAGYTFLTLAMKEMTKAITPLLCAHA